MRLIDADALRRKLDKEIVEYPDERAGMNPFERYVHRVVPRLILGVINLIECEPTIEAVPIGNCDGCHWKGRRHQKCSCCRRNRHMKDNYESEGL